MAAKEIKDMIRVIRVYGEGDTSRVEVREQTFWAGKSEHGKIHLHAEFTSMDSPNHIFKGRAYPDATGYLVLEAI